MKHMYEPKYKLNKRDAERYHALVIRECLTGNLDEKALAKARRSRKYKPLSPAEAAELEVLQKKRSKKVMAHPRVQEQFRRSKNVNRQLRRAVKKFQDSISAAGQACDIYEKVFPRKNKPLTSKSSASTVWPT